MIGAIIGDFVGVPYEFDGDRNKKYLARLDFPLFTKKSEFTDDTVMTIAVGEAVMNGRIISVGMVCCQRPHSTCKRTCGNETKAEPTIHSPRNDAKWGYPKQECRTGKKVKSKRL